MSNEPEVHKLGDLATEFCKLWGVNPEDVLKLYPNYVPPSTAELVRKQRMDRFKEFCPDRFREKIDREKIPNLAAWDEADKWSGGHPGIWLWSHDTGEAKTRMLWRKFGELHVNQGKTILKMTGQQMSEEYFRCHMDGDPGNFYRMMTKYNIVMLDDLDKADLANERTPRMIREVFDRFYEAKTPLLVTANQSIDWFSDKIGESGARRMRETCREIAF